MFSIDWIRVFISRVRSNGICYSVLDNSFRYKKITLNERVYKLLMSYEPLSWSNYKDFFIKFYSGNGSYYDLKEWMYSELIMLSEVPTCDAIVKAHLESLNNQGQQELKMSGLIAQEPDENFAFTQLQGTVGADGKPMLTIPVASLSTNADWIAKAYPLKQITIIIQGQKFSTREEMISQLSEITTRLKLGDDAGEHYDDDFGYLFKSHETNETAFVEAFSFK